MEKMNRIVKAMLTLFALSVLLVLMTNCGGDDPKESESDRVKIILRSGTWKVQTVTVDGVDQTALYENLTLTFTDTQYTTTNGANVWPASGGWHFTDESATTILRSDDVIIAVGASTTTTLLLSFDWPDTTIGPGRASSVQGAHVFTFGK